MHPTFVLSLDEELIWGSFDHTSEVDFARRHPDLRGVVHELLELFERHDIRATWALVGHLFLDSCPSPAHPELVRPSYAWYPHDWLAKDPTSDRAQHPLWYGDDLVATIRAAKPAHEIGCHSFSHLVYGDPGCSAAAAASDLAACVRVAQSQGVALRSFVFPRNAEGHHALLAQNGFSAYRGEEPHWYRRLSRTAGRAAHLVDQAFALAPPVSKPQQTHPGLWNISGSMLFLHREGVRRFIPLRQRVRKAKKGIDRAIAQNAVFHLWFHPFNMCTDRAKMFRALEEILVYVKQTRIAVQTMGELAAELSA